MPPIFPFTSNFKRERESLLLFCTLITQPKNKIKAPVFFWVNSRKFMTFKGRSILEYWKVLDQKTWLQNQSSPRQENWSHHYIFTPHFFEPNRINGLIYNSLCKESSALKSNNNLHPQIWSFDSMEYIKICHKGGNLFQSTMWSLLGIAQLPSKKHLLHPFLNV